ncbi:hypothetical protein P7K49_034547 [Saguinus oedipus]|uniref:Uncharacterized protein n=1 Tax=Saguinus oedipus TaxID=9490 RepID=A0ABQ9TV20_SAGOE|nr:hypothetical protein P7K49_034547 [Saguinus oedipus]
MSKKKAAAPLVKCTQPPPEIPTETHPSASSRTMGPLPPSAVAQGAQLLIRPVDKSINTTFICNVTSSLGARQAELTVQVKEGPPSEPPGMSWSVIVVPILGILAVLAMLGSDGCQHLG